MKEIVSSYVIIIEGFLLSLDTIKKIGVDSKKNKAELHAKRFMTSIFGTGFILLLGLNAS